MSNIFSIKEKQQHDDEKTNAVSATSATISA